ncbi:hypothetical protein C8Q73DRAFT_502901 [Cubamyces lactineus]|nr:hypothetical protein C8Q73DRAFT_502901 [Cubamyces lactineus]
MIAGEYLRWDVGWGPCRPVHASGISSIQAGGTCTRGLLVPCAVLYVPDVRRCPPSPGTHRLAYMGACPYVPRTPSPNLPQRDVLLRNPCRPLSDHRRYRLCPHVPRRPSPERPLPTP